ncbi:DNRLRE domain-containing protein [Nonomuraea lactucae]|uniref:DNRLRE domain-containing protein n=1 Tax=Nonomuraea lactucae TaxID=2249762 RepID=UPI000DE2AB0D|nr:DNRLRE domain-containing protein [Nonomuraea lactucae]
MAAPAIAQGPTPSPSPTARPTGTDTPTGAALAKAKKDNKRVEIEALRSETGTYYANPDGKTLRAELSSTPVRVKKDGAWQPVDPTLVEEGGVLRPKASEGDLELSPGGDSTAVSYTDDKGRTAIAAPTTLPKPVVKGNTATYPSAYGPGTDLVVTVTPSGFRHDVVIRQRPAKDVKLRVPMRLPKGLKLGNGPDKAPGVLDAKGKQVTSLGQATMVDAAALKDPDQGLIGQASAEIERTADGDSVVFTAKASFLTDPAIAYPVTVTTASETWEGTGIAGDTHVSNVKPSGQENSTLPWLLAGRSHSGSQTHRSYIRFNIHGTPLEGGTVHNADLRLHNQDSHTCTDTDSPGVVAHRITTDWNIATLTWSNQPSITTSGQYGNKGAYSATRCPEGEGELYFSIEQMVQAWMDGQPDNGVRLISASETVAQNWRYYRSDEYGGYDTYPFTPRGPVLFIEYEPAAVPMQAVYVRPRSSSAPTLDEVLGHMDDSVDYEPADPDAVTPTQLESDAEQSTEAVGSMLKDAALPDGMTPEETERWSNPDIGEDPMQSPAPKSAVAHWLFDEATGTTAADSTVEGNKATLKSGTTWIPGKTGTALSNTPAADQPLSQATAEARRAAALKAVKQDKRVEVPEETSETSITYAMPDGRSFTTEVTAGPMRIRRGSAWVPIDTTLAERDGVLKPKAIAGGTSVEISTGGSGPFVTMTRPQGRTYALSWPTPLPKPTVKGGVATFTDAAGKGGDLVVTLLPTGFRHDVVLRERPARPLELRIGVESTGLTLSEGKGGRLLLTDNDKQLVASAAQPVMWDGRAKGRRPLAKSAKVNTDVVAKQGHTELVLKPDHAFLTNTDTIYPVRVDPTVALPLSSDVEVSSSSDADWPADPTSPFMMAGTQAGGFKYRVHLKFDTATLPGSTVTDAKLSMNTIDAQNCGTTVGAGIQTARLTSAWDPDNVHWDNTPAFTTEDASTNTKGVNQNCATWPDAMEWNVTGIAQDWAAGAANHGLVLKSPGEDNVNNYRVFTASEDTDFAIPPKLTITSSGPASSPSASALAITPSQVVGGTTVAGSLTPQLAATVADTVSGDLTGEFEIEHDPAATGQGTGQIWAGASAAVPSGGQAVVTVPAGKLTDGWKVRWRARAVNNAAATASAWSAWQLATIDVPDLPSGPSVSALQVTPSALVDGKTTTSSLTPQLRAQANDPAGGTLRADFEIEHDPAAPQQGSGQIWAGNADNVTAGTQASVTVPAGKLADGWLVRWRARAASATATSPWSDWQLLTVDPANVGDEPLAAVDTPVIRTDESFAIAGWVRLDDRDGRYTIAEQKGTSTAPFHLGVDPAHGLVFTMKQSDSATSSEEGAVSETAPPVGEWFHLSGSYDGDSRSLSLYLNGNLIKTQTISFRPWHADGPFTIGTVLKGGIDDLWVFPRTLSAAEVSELYAHPGETASPVATTSASRVSVTSRESRETKGATPLAANPLPWPTGKSHPLRYTSYEQCDADVARAAPRFTNFRSRFSGCYSGQVVAVDAERVNNVLTVKGTVKGDITLLVDADQSSRAVVIQAKFDNVVGSGTLATTSVGLKLKPKGYPDSTHCQPKQTSPFGPNLREKPQASWNSSPVENWGMSSSAVGAEGKDLKATCRFSLLVKVTPIGSKTRYVNLWTKAGVSDKEFQVRCDSAAYVYTPSDGCVFTYLKPYMEMRRNDVNDKGQTWEEQYDHIRKALTDPNSSPTYPALGGPSYPHSAGRRKDMPGGSPQRPIHRIVSDPLYDLNAAQRTKSEAVCHREIAKTWISDVKYDPLAKNCDEFPFASTDEGSLGANPDFNYSVRLIRATHNQAHGHVLGAWYGNNRILKRDGFWVKLS